MQRRRANWSASSRSPEADGAGGRRPSEAAWERGGGEDSGGGGVAGGEVSGGAGGGESPPATPIPESGAFIPPTIVTEFLFR